VAAYCTAFMSISEQMALDVTELLVEGVQLTVIRLQPEVRLRTGMGFEKVHDMFRRAAALAKNRSQVPRTLAASLNLTIAASRGEVR